MREDGAFWGFDGIRVRESATGITWGVFDDTYGVGNVKIPANASLWSRDQQPSGDTVPDLLALQKTRIQYCK